MNEAEKNIEVKRIEITKGITELALDCAKEIEKNKSLEKELQEKEEEIKRLKNNLISLGQIVKENKEKWEYLSGRFVQVNYCSDDQRTKCPLYPIDCQGDNCKEFVDLFTLLDKAIDENGIK